MLLLLPFTFISYTWKALPYLVNRPFVVYHIPTRRLGETVRALIFNHPSTHQRVAVGRLRPLHVDIHGGGFIGGIPEYDAPFCTQVAKTTGAVVISVAYRFAPRYPYPAAHDDVEDAILWLLKNAEGLFGADPDLLTVSGSSAGGTLALGAALILRKREGKDLIKGIVTLYSPVRLFHPLPRSRSPRLTQSFAGRSPSSSARQTQAARVSVNRPIMASLPTV